MRIATIGCVLVLMAGGTAAAQGTQDSPGRTPLMLEVAARGYLAGGRMGSMAGDSAVDRLESYVWADQTLCGMGAGDQAPSNTPWTGWHFTGTVLVDAPGQMTVRIDWQRLWENGARLQNGPSGSQTLTLRNGERAELDRIAPTTVGSCGTIEAKLEAAVMARAPYLVGVSGGVAGGMRGGVGAGARGGAGRGAVGAGAVSGSGAGATGGVASTGAGRGVGAGGGRGAGAGATAGTGVTGGVAGTGMGRGVGTGGGRGAGTGVRGGVASMGGTTGVAGGVRGGRGVSGPLGLRQKFGPALMMTRTPYDAEIWLVHKTPDGSEHVQQMSVRFMGTTREFAFPSVQVPSNGGPITLDITGSLQVQSGPGQYTLGYGAEANRLKAARGATGARGSSEPAATPAEPPPTPLFVVSIARHARRATPFIDTRGTTDLSIQMPKPEDVFSFELPPLQKATEDLLKGHTFSIRLRMTPAK